METKQTAIEWLMERLPHSIESQYKKYILQAKIIEKEQIIDGVFAGYNYDGARLEEYVKQYYSKNYGK